MIREMMTIHGKRCVAIEEAELRRLERLAGRESPLPPLPAADAKGNRPALEYIQVSIARDIIKERHWPQPNAVGGVGRPSAGNRLSARIGKAFADGADRGKDRPGVEAVRQVKGQTAWGRAIHGRPIFEWPRTWRKGTW